MTITMVLAMAVVMVMVRVRVRVIVMRMSVATVMVMATAKEMVETRSERTVKGFTGCRAAYGRWSALLLLILFSFSGCSSLFPKPDVPAPEQVPIFPPQATMESGDYKGFLAQNEEVLKTFGEGDKECGIALFNLGFLYAYSKSPYYNPQKAIGYFERLTREYSKTPLAFQAEAWLDVMKKGLTTQEGQQRLQKKVKSKDATINQLQQQIQRSREIDQEMDQKERELLQ
jgi:hypothetical protein